MADERDPQVSQRYRELGAEEPPRALDDAILAASRRATTGEMRSRPAPLVAPAGPRRWYFPVAAAAIITLAVAVTVQVERQKPDDEFFAAQTPAPKPVEEKAELALKEERALKSAPAKVKPAPQSARSGGFTPDPAAPAPGPQSADALRDLAKSSEPAAAAEAPRQAEAESRARAQVPQRGDAAETKRMEEQGKAQRSAPPPAAAAARPAPAPQAAPKPQDGMRASGAVAALHVGPQRWLEQIAELRKEGKHDDADKLLEEFRKTYPDYRISDEMRAKVERPK